MNVEQLAKRIEALEESHAIVAIQATMNRYTRSADFGPPEDWVDCFMPDGTYETVLEDGRVVARGQGPEALLAVVRASNATYTGGRHFIMAPDIHVDGDTATATSLMGTFAGLPDNARFRLIGRYEDVLRRCADGRWRFVSRRSLIQGRAAEFAAELRS
ncbi:MAG: hypothetical protein QOH08_937 [Chloroflexota bacterium]|jgi:hypothetical protein|nr:hypothetical protein [Chloroflexota bacterium]